MATTRRPRFDAAVPAAPSRAIVAVLAGLTVSVAAAQTPTLAPPGTAAQAPTLEPPGTATQAPTLDQSGAAVRRPTFELGISSELSWTSNSSFGLEAGEEDAVLEVRPTLRARRQGGRVQLDGFASLTGVAYANGTQPRRIDPTADLSARIEAIERLFFVEVGYRAAQTSADVFGARPGSGSTANTLTTSQWRVSPFIEGVAGNDLRYRLRSDNTWTREIGEADADAGAGGYFGRHSASIEQEPRPFGWRLEADHSLTRYDNPDEDEISTQIARAIVNYAVTSEWSVGLRGGRERNDVAGADLPSESIYGFETRWQPSPRTTLSANGERRFFGNGWNLAFSHRRPRLAWNLSLNRGIDTTPQSLFDLPPTDNVAGLLDAMFTTRFPDPVERAGVVQEFIARQGLPNATTRPISLFAQRFSVATTRQASVSLIGARNTLTFSGFSARTEDALDSGPFAIGDASTNNVQHGATAVLSHRLTLLTALAVTADWSRIRALDAVDETTERGLRVQINLQAGPKTNAVLGGRYRKIDSNVAFEGREGAVFMGLDHRF